jgi:hypothetical protein
VRFIQYADRTALPWKIKDIGRETLVKYHGETSFNGLGFSARLDDAFFRKLDALDWQDNRGRPGPSLRGSAIVPVLGALTAHRQ